MAREFEHDGEYGEEWLAIIPSDLGKDGAAYPLSEQRAHLWSLVLEARSIPSRIESGVGGWILNVPAAYFAAACSELRLFEVENRNWPPPVRPHRPLVGNTLPTLSVLILLATFHNLTRLDISLPGHASIDWIDIGNAHAARILDGQWWRLVTALTLHGDWLHLLSNLTIGGIFILLLCRELGSGLAWSLLLGAGALGNLANAILQLSSHRSVGASTAVFGAVGIFAAISMVRYPRHAQRRWLLPIAAALALLAVLGTEGKSTDLGAHLFGFVFGAVLGGIAEKIEGRYGRPGRRLNALLALLCGVVVATAWWCALLYGG
ncbi:rhomboid family intramembrane serine protease [Geomobilimonas luticola]|uniref:Rhomboid family intramembrane serine protease n=1 Tax=Geomobilimonas luticola TaxID=1114878 RepID=A0ABS5SH48_9BACT|nr:rhomboid family intramembrane serine protease [Geomobilimonas luticola]MBT0654560.1 rhomboid family intramembrane serine protease [Geomobilimonas luticola]